MTGTAEISNLIGGSSSVDGLLETALQGGAAVEYSTGLRKTRLTGKDAQDRIRSIVADSLLRHDPESLRKGVLRAMEMPSGRNGAPVRALCLAPADTDLGLFSLLALAASGATIVLAQEGKIQAVSEIARSHEATHLIACPFTLAQMMKRLRRKYAKSGKTGSLDKAVDSKGLGRLLCGSVLKQAATGLTGPTVQVICTDNDGLNPEVLRFFSGLGYQTSYCENPGKTGQDPLETAADIMNVRAAVLCDAGNLVVSLDPGLSPRRTASAVRQVEKAVRETGKDVRIVFTSSDLSSGGCRIDREKVGQALAAGSLDIIGPENLPENGVMTEDEVKAAVTRTFASVLDRPVEEISYGGDFFRTFNGESMDYFVLLGNLESQFDVELSSRDGSRMSSVRDITRCIMKQMED